MEAGLKKMETQLRRWRLRIDDLAAKTEVTGAQAGFDALTYIDELKALLATAQSKLTDFEAAGDEERAGLRAETRSAWDELDAALKNRRRYPSRRDPDRGPRQ